MGDEGDAVRKARKLRASRDRWTQRSAEKQKQIRQLRVTNRDLSTSRDRWKARVMELEQQLRAVHATAEHPSADRSGGLWLFGGPDRPSVDDPPDSPPLAGRLITPEELSRAKGHLYPLLLVRLSLTWVCAAHASYRGVALIFSSLQGVVAAVGPCAETIRLWLLRVGLFLLRRPMPRCPDWVFLVDLTIQLGAYKCLVILGVRLSALRRNGYSPAHHDVQVLSVAVLTRCDGETVAAHLGTLSNRLGVPVQVVSDHGSDVLAGIRSWKRTQQEPRRVVETYDITHGLALLLKDQLEPDARWAGFVTECQSTRQQLQQTAGCFLRPPAWRSKARFLDLGSHLKCVGNGLEAHHCFGRLSARPKPAGFGEGGR